MLKILKYIKRHLDIWKGKFNIDESLKFNFIWKIKLLKLPNYQITYGHILYLEFVNKHAWLTCYLKVCVVKLFQKK